MAPLLLLSVFAGAVIAGYAYSGRSKTPAAGGAMPQLPPAPPTTIPTIPLAPPAGAPSIAPPIAPPSTSRPIVPASALFPGTWKPYRFERTRTGFQHDHVNLNDPSVARWQPMIFGAATVWAPRMGVPLDQLVRFAVAWEGVESGGNVCAVGDKYQLHAGAPKEIGLWQIYNPSDFRELGISPAELLAYCVRPAPGDKPNTSKMNPQRLSRPLTDIEAARHVEIGMRFIHMKREYALGFMHDAGIAWPATSIDTWRMTKLVHGLPVIVNTGIAQVARRLGRPPSSWAEFRATYETINPRAVYKPGAKKQDGYWRALQNAEWTGGHVQPFANA